jgi:anti-sigma B factor antagonist
LQHERDRVIVLRGQLDIASLPQLREALRDVHLAAASDVVVDFAEVSFCDAAPLGVLAVTASRLADRGFRLQLLNVRPRQAKVIRLCGLANLLAEPPAARTATRDETCRS